MHRLNWNVEVLSYLDLHFKTVNQCSCNTVCAPLEGWEMPDPFQVVGAELLHVKQRLLLLAAQHAERLRVEVLQQGQLQSEKVDGLFTACLNLFYR